MVKSYLRIARFNKLLKTHNLNLEEFSKLSGLGQSHISMIASKKISVGVWAKEKMVATISELTGEGENFNEWFR